MIGHIVSLSDFPLNFISFHKIYNLLDKDRENRILRCYVFFF